ncbi:MAG TPA: tRNA lysidine(34) synthetase TilS [Candidatus Scybalocola faecigallinarum]|uniref:tRNA(Ile)-lysidine synthase n=1 Tax=Candidatus Scybalocola faecigallinarum TaxID=2840941 RepID=A0A9D1F611_9FIRM|nr:tRNA lysidine(34) synthetase TilS [Candidatus Scybalocola faecigallinarum]
MDNTVKKVEKYIADNHMLSPGDRVVVGVSGGADSMCLLFVLMTLARSLALELCVVHVNHGIRGKAAREDQEFVENFCNVHGLLWKNYQGDVPGLAQEKKMSHEEAGRMFRYECFENALKSLGWANGKIAVAHNKNDVAETFLMNIFRGSGLRGLTGILPVRGNIIRPLLVLERKEIESLLARTGIPCCTDQTNFENTYTRNRIRNTLIPYVEENINSGAVRHMWELAGETRELADYIQKMADEAWQKAARPDGSLDAGQMQTMEPVICREVLRRSIGKAAGRLKDITREHIYQVMELLDKPVGKRVCLPYGLTVVKGYDALKFLMPEALETSRKEEIPEGGEFFLEIPEQMGITSTIRVEAAGFCVALTLKGMEENQRIEEKQYTKWLDYDKIKDRLKLRFRQKDDYLIVDRRGSRKLLRRLMIDEKIPKEERDKVWLIADGSHIVWMIGGRISEAYKITENTKKILEIKIKGEE